MTPDLNSTGGRQSGLPGTLATVRCWNIAIGNFFFRYRNALFPAVFLLVALTIRPGIILGSPTLDRILPALGAAVALAGQMVRLITIGCDYIHRGGKDGQVYAQRLVQGGMYAITRNPMYLGNALIAVGMTMVAGSPIAYVLVIPFFLFVYQAMVSAEEEYLRNKFGRDYDEYCATVNRFVPFLHGVRQSFSGMRYDWKRALRKDLGTIVGLTMGFILLSVWRTYFLHGLAAAEAAALRVAYLVIGGSILYGLLLYLKKRRRLFY